MVVEWLEFKNLSFIVDWQLKVLENLEGYGDATRNGFLSTFLRFFTYSQCPEMITLSLQKSLNIAKNGFPLNSLVKPLRNDHTTKNVFVLMFLDNFEIFM